MAFQWETAEMLRKGGGTRILRYKVRFLRIFRWVFHYPKFQEDLLVTTYSFNSTIYCARLRAAEKVILRYTVLLQLSISNATHAIYINYIPPKDPCTRPCPISSLS